MEDPQREIWRYTAYFALFVVAWILVQHWIIQLATYPGQ